MKVRCSCTAKMKNPPPLPARDKFSLVHSTVTSLLTERTSAQIINLNVANKVKISRDRPRWPKGFQVG